eukprot:8169443-Alexandrium_andersonii.AAC.1
MRPCPPELQGSSRGQGPIAGTTTAANARPGRAQTHPSHHVAGGSAQWISQATVQKKSLRMVVSRIVGASRGASKLKPSG